ncbi:hypothetical protein [Clostridium beijerinckii]|uniref:Uncharacterized protein n=1 Tax=Clostridium beijerinckii TaxID=1520 RepID=A0A9Q5D5G0_CLOBE|nr:hypothetical protein [Clostridium beijerinckii]AQS04176.1 hypothetical protein CLBIJ_15950 [Clostridium beijerinckii]MBA2883933.1 hypothetical protein [Clostridium beijerinckii]MBA2899118.1 hypothetical protein [Clostridium beijerinckii]MBA2908518.1 hypothetical protein [Clostridium beijerinckii]MBA9016272.1 hypothetical protein [Clostridium beijerinckii]
MDYQNRADRARREKVIKRGAEISSRLQAIGNIQKRTKNKDLFQDQRDKMRKELLEARKEL